MPRKVLLVNVSGEHYDHSQNPPQSPFMKGGEKKILPFSKGESEGICSVFSLN
jgi:hypothetical protein